MIDFVILWVDGNDSLWQEDFRKYSDQEGDKRVVRFRDWDNLHFWFRGVEKFAPWVNKIHFITYGHLPKWLNIDHPKLNIVRHSDYIPEHLLPTFNSNVIELFIHKIKGLSDKFVLFNDDCFMIDHVEKLRFFKNGLPCDMAIANVIAPIDLLNYNCMNNCKFINSYFNKLDVVKHNFCGWYNLKYGKYIFKNILLSPWKYFTGFIHPHFPQPFLKETFQEVWDKNQFSDKNFSRFRDKNNYTQYLMSSWQLVTKKFYPINLYQDSLYLDINDKNIHFVENTILRQNKNILVLNDTDPHIQFEILKNAVNEAFNQLLPNRSFFELEKF